MTNTSKLIRLDYNDYEVRALEHVARTRGHGHHWAMTWTELECRWLWTMAEWDYHEAQRNAKFVALALKWTMPIVLGLLLLVPTLARADSYIEGAVLAERCFARGIDCPPSGLKSSAGYNLEMSALHSRLGTALPYILRFYRDATVLGEKPSYICRTTLTSTPASACDALDKNLP